MILVLIAAILFGLVHPGSKLILGTGLDLITFCMLYVAIRLLAQIPVVVRNRSYLLHSKDEAWILICIGFVGAILQFSEFSGIASGLPVSYCHLPGVQSSYLDNANFRLFKRRQN